MGYERKIKTCCERLPSIFAQSGDQGGLHCAIDGEVLFTDDSPGNVVIRDMRFCPFCGSAFQIIEIAKRKT